MASRRSDPAKALSAYVDGLRTLGDWLTTVPADGWMRPSVLPGWTVAELAAHMLLVADGVTTIARAGKGTVPLCPADYMARYSAIAGDIDANTRAAVPPRIGDATGAQLSSAIGVKLDQGVEIIAAWSPDTVVQGGRGPIRLADYLATRAVEVAVHADDLARSVPDVAAPQLPRDCVRLAVRTLLDALAAKAPGRTVEVRVPPIGAVQCVEGPRHTRGTPSNVIEMDATTWLRLAAGREPWHDAVQSGQISASGGRADLSPWLPLL